MLSDFIYADLKRWTRLSTTPLTSHAPYWNERRWQRKKGHALSPLSWTKQFCHPRSTGIEHGATLQWSKFMILRKELVSFQTKAIHDDSMRIMKVVTATHQASWIEGEISFHYHDFIYVAIWTVLSTMSQLCSAKRDMRIGLRCSTTMSLECENEPKQPLSISVQNDCTLEKLETQKKSLPSTSKTTSNCIDHIFSTLKGPYAPLNKKGRLLV